MLHDVLADHTDMSAQASAGKPGTVSKTGFNCNRLDLVAESPFIADEAIDEKEFVKPCSQFFALTDNTTALQVIALPDLRGPPAI